MPKYKIEPSAIFIVGLFSGVTWGLIAYFVGQVPPKVAVLVSIFMFGFVPLVFIVSLYRRSV